MIEPILPESIETERLLIRIPCTDDALDLNRAIRETYDELHQWMPWADHVPTVEETLEHIRRARRPDDPSDGSLIALLKETDKHVVSIGLHPRNPAVPSFEIGYWRRQGFNGHGYVTEAVKAVSRAAFEILGAKRLEIRCDALNIPSRRVAERSGFQLEGILRNYEIGAGGNLRDTLVFGLLPPDIASVDFSRP